MSCDVFPDFMEENEPQRKMRTQTASTRRGQMKGSENDKDDHITGSASYQSRTRNATLFKRRVSDARRASRSCESISNETAAADGNAEWTHLCRRNDDDHAAYASTRLGGDQFISVKSSKYAGASTVTSFVSFRSRRAFRHPSSSHSERILTK